MNSTQMSQPNFELLGDRVLIKLDEHPSHTTTESGIVIPQFEATTTDGGKPTSTLSKMKYLYQGTVIQLSPYAQEKLPSITPSTRVYITPSALSPAYQFFLDRSKLVIDFDGHICIPHTLIEAKLITNEQEN